MLGREDYLARKQAKITYYRDEGTPLIEWDTHGPLPELGRLPLPGGPGGGA